MDLLVILSWIVFGLVVGLLARLLIPGRDPAGWIATIALGIVGSVVGGVISYALKLGTDPWAPAGWLLSILGAVVTLLVYYWATGAKRRS